MQREAPRLTDFIHDLRGDDIPDDALHMARRCVLDTLGVWAAGLKTEASRIARNHSARRHAGALPLPLDGRRVSPAGFAFAGAASVDAVDGHDGHELCKGHASVALLPGMLAEGRSDLADFVMGTEIAIRAGMALHATVPDYHASGAWNALGCAAMSSRARGLSKSATWDALGIAEYYGPRAQMMRCIAHPTMVKDSSAWGAFTGVTAADLAEDGFTGAPAVTCEGADVADIWGDLGSRWRILETNFKAYPVCRWSHPAIEGVRDLMRTHAIAAKDVARIEVATFEEATQLTTRRPKDGDAAQYSLPLAVALMLVDGHVSPPGLVPGGFDRPDIWAVVDQTRLTRHAEYSRLFPEERLADVHVVLADGTRHSAFRCAARGASGAPLTDAELIEKFNAFAAPTLASKDRQTIAALLDGEDHDTCVGSILNVFNRPMASSTSQAS